MEKKTFKRVEEVVILFGRNRSLAVVLCMQGDTSREMNLGALTGTQRWAVGGEGAVSQQGGHATELGQVKSTDLCVQRYLAL